MITVEWYRRQLEFVHSTRLLNLPLLTWPGPLVILCRSLRHLPLLSSYFPIAHATGGLVPIHRLGSLYLAPERLISHQIVELTNDCLLGLLLSDRFLVCWLLPLPVIIRILSQTVSA